MNDGIEAAKEECQGCVGVSSELWFVLSSLSNAALNAELSLSVSLPLSLQSTQEVADWHLE